MIIWIDNELIKKDTQYETVEKISIQLEHSLTQSMGFWIRRLHSLQTCITSIPKWKKKT